MHPRAVSASRLVLSVLAAAVLGLSACAHAPAPQGINDPYEQSNRRAFQATLAIDKNLIRPVGVATAKIVPRPVSRGITNFADNLGVPGDVINDLLQARLDRAVHNTLRFAFNTTIGIGGIFDPATAMGLTAKPTDFGETLSVWGVSEGAYLVVPVLGPSTERDLTGKVVDLILDPTWMFIPKAQRWVGTAATVVSKVDDRGRYSDTYDSVLYGSADSYAQARLLYLEHRRYNLGQTPAASDFEDPYAK
ncbi:VacJ family lipoprotein [bacterium]|nr:VacJ family lipoprotein [bacterium]